MGDDVPAFKNRLGAAIVGAFALAGLALLAIGRGPHPGPCTGAELRALSAIGAYAAEARGRDLEFGRRLADVQDQFLAAREICAHGAHDAGRAMLIGLVDGLQASWPPLAAAAAP
ncbi:MAG: hypothetical protein JNK67_19685 [Alphaproteobacteria bacterium]|nr:hypothetical protein [Alphaproteobacteria bacterium]